LKFQAVAEKITKNF